MNISSAQSNCSITSSDVITIDLSSITTSAIDTSSIGTITIGNSGSVGIGTTYQGTYTTDFSNIWTAPIEWQDSFPAWDRVQKMCDMYPGLKIAFENFKTTYNLVKDDYDTPPEKRIKP